MRPGKLTPTTILTALDSQLMWTASDCDKDSLNYATFEKILMDDTELISYARTVREKWLELARFGYFTRSNQYSAIVDLNLVRAKLSKERAPTLSLPSSVSLLRMAEGRI